MRQSRYGVSRVAWLARLPYVRQSGVCETGRDSIQRVTSLVQY